MERRIRKGYKKGVLWGCYGAMNVRFPTLIGLRRGVCGWGVWVGSAWRGAVIGCVRVALMEGNAHSGVNVPRIRLPERLTY